MDKLRRAAERLLEALDDGWVQRDDWVAITLRQAIEQAEKQEPKAWIYEGNLHIFDPTDWAIEPESVQPLYTAPPKREWVGLTDEEIVAVNKEEGTCWEVPDKHATTISKAIEAKLRERNT
jgi:hypothetical protein